MCILHYIGVERKTVKEAKAGIQISSDPKSGLQHLSLPSCLWASACPSPGSAGGAPCVAFPSQAPPPAGAWQLQRNRSMNLNPLWERNTSNIRCLEVLDDLSRCPIVCGGDKVDDWRSPDAPPEWDAWHSGASGVLSVPQKTHVSQVCLIGLAQGKFQPTVGVLPK